MEALPLRLQTKVAGWQNWSLDMHDSSSRLQPQHCPESRTRGSAILIQCWAGVSHPHRKSATPVITSRPPPVFYAPPITLGHSKHTALRRTIIEGSSRGPCQWLVARSVDRVVWRGPPQISKEGHKNLGWNVGFPTILGAWPGAWVQLRELLQNFWRSCSENGLFTLRVFFWKGGWFPNLGTQGCMIVIQYFVWVWHPNRETTTLLSTSTG